MGTKEILEKLKSIGLAEFPDTYRYCSYHASAIEHSNGNISSSISLTIYFQGNSYISSETKGSLDEAFESLAFKIKVSKTDYSTSELIDL